jgi:hypothetical protein
MRPSRFPVLWFFLLTYFGLEVAPLYKRVPVARKSL